jgi:hypothetical protein
MSDDLNISPIGSMSAHIKHWYQRHAELSSTGIGALPQILARDAEIAELRAALAAFVPPKARGYSVLGSFPYPSHSPPVAAPVPQQAAGDTYADAEYASWEPAMRRPSVWTYGWVHSEFRDAWADSLNGVRYVPPQLDWSDSSPSEGKPQS